MKIKFFLIIIIIYLLFGCSKDDKGYIHIVTAPQQINYSVFASHLIEIEVYPKQSGLSCQIVYHFGDKSGKIKKNMKEIVKSKSKFKIELEPITYGTTLFYSIRCELTSNEYIYYPSETSEKYFSVIRDRYCQGNDECLGGELCILESCKLQPEFCSSASDCPIGQKCNIIGDQKCYIPLTICNSDDNCSITEYCFEESCFPKGISCSDDQNCFIGQTCSDGFCKNLRNCFGDSDCPETMSCHLSMEKCILKRECSEDLECESGKICNQYIGHCVEHLCQLHSDCYEGEICDPITQICTKSDEIECYNDLDCQNSYCNINTLKCVSCIYHSQCNENQICFENECIN